MSETTTKQTSLSIEDAKHYLNLYLGKADWDKAISRLYEQTRRKKNAQALMREIISCAILMPVEEGTRVPTDPTKLLFWASSPSNLMLKDSWFDALQDVIKQDQKIQQNRHVVSTLGVIHPIDYSPMTRQAFNWVYRKGLDMGHINDSNKKEVEKKLKNLVSVYGGRIICSLFERDSGTSPVLDKVINWYGGYFIERLIFDMYSLDNVMKIKKQELEKTNKDLIVRLTNKN